MIPRGILTYYFVVFIWWWCSAAAGSVCILLSQYNINSYFHHDDVVFRSSVLSSFSFFHVFFCSHLRSPKLPQLLRPSSLAGPNQRRCINEANPGLHGWTLDPAFLLAETMPDIEDAGVVVVLSVDKKSLIPHQHQSPRQRPTKQITLCHRSLLTPPSYICIEIGEWSGLRRISYEWLVNHLFNPLDRKLA